MKYVYLGAAAIGGLLLIVQLLLSLLGGDGDGDVTPDAGDAGAGAADAAEGHIAVSFRTVVAFITFFGIGGMAATTSGVSPTWTPVIALASGSAAFWLMGLALVQMNRLRSSGNVEIENAVGCQGKVYLTVPAERGGTGSVTVLVQGRTVQFRAITRGTELETGALCKVVGVPAHDTLEVEAV